MSNNATPANAPATPSFLKENGGALAICLVTLAVIGLIIFAVVKAVKQCSMANDQMAPIGTRKCNTGDEGPIANCGKWECRGPCPAGFYSTGVMCTSYVKDPITKQYATVAHTTYEPK